MGLSVVVAEDAFIVREGVRMLLEGAGYDLQAAVESFDELLDAVEAGPPDVVITDIRMPPTRTDEGVRAAREIKDRHPGVGVVVLSQYVEPAYALTLFEGGAEGIAYLLKERLGDLEHLEHAINEVRAGRSVIDPSDVSRIVNEKCSERLQKARATQRSLRASFSRSAQLRNTSTRYSPSSISSPRRRRIGGFARCLCSWQKTRSDRVVFPTSQSVLSILWRRRSTPTMKE